ncbi:MAG: asparaginase [Gemmatimonadales bacterium]
MTTRGPLVESRHRISAAVVDPSGHLVAEAGDPDLVTFWRSASKPFQLLPLVEAGGVDRFGLDTQMLALACGSHNGELIHREVGARWLEAVGIIEEQLACGGHPSLLPRLAHDMIRVDVSPTPLWSNCSGKHASLLSQAVMEGWSLDGYELRGHPVQNRVEATVSRWTATPRGDLAWGVDGCTAAAVALPLRGMATGYARLGADPDPALVLVRDAMMQEPYMVAGADRLDTALMQAWPSRIAVKIGAGGVYSAALPSLGLGVALKVDDGDMKAAGLALVAMLQDLTAQVDPQGDWPVDGLDRWIAPPIRNTREEITGGWDVQGCLRYC